MAISAAALADDLGTEGSNVTSKLGATTVTTGISLGFWFDNLASRNRLRKIAQGYLVWFIVSGWLLLYPLTESGQWPSMVMACMCVVSHFTHRSQMLVACSQPVPYRWWDGADDHRWTLYGALMNYLASKGPMPFGLDIFSICRQMYVLLPMPVHRPHVSSHSRFVCRGSQQLNKVERYTDAGDQLPRNLYLTDGGTCRSAVCRCTSTVHP